MRYRYNCGDEVIEVFVWNDDFHDAVEVDDPKTDKVYRRTIREDKKGKFFTWNCNKVYLDNWIKITLKELKERVEKGEWITSNDLCQAILTDGIEKARFIVPFNTVCNVGLSLGFKFLLNGNEYKDTLCKVEERFNREVKNNYKIVLVPVKADDSIASSSDYYTSDFVELIKSGQIKIVA